MPVFVFTDTRRTPSVSACSSLYQSLIVSPGVAVTAPVGLKVRSTSLSLKTTLVRGSLLANGYMIAHGGTVAGAPPVQAPPLQVSLVVQALPSLQGAVLLTWTQPVEGLQVSSVQTLPSLQEGAGPPTHRPPLQASLVVQALPSLQGSVLSLRDAPAVSLLANAYMIAHSWTVAAAPPVQPPPLQVSLVVQALPSVQGAVLFV